MSESESEHRQVFESLGAFALGSLDAEEHDLVVAHLETCPVCAEDAAALQRAATRLIDVVPSLEPSPAVRDRIMAVVEPEAALLRAAAAERAPAAAAREGRRGARAWLAPSSARWVAAGAALLAVGAILGVVLPGSDGSPTRTLQAQIGRGHAWVETKDDRSQLVLDDLPAPAKGKVYEVWVQHGSSPAQPAAGDLRDAVFVVSSGRIDIPARLERGDRVMVTAEPAGGSPSPTSAPVVVTARA